MNNNKISHISTDIVKRKRGNSFIVLTEDGLPRYSNFHGPYSIKISPSTQQKIYNLVINEKNEVSGVITSDSSIKNLKFGDPQKSPIQQERLIHQIPFHTHPKSTYATYNTKYAWPSQGDVRLIPAADDPMVTSHLLFTVEGIYLLAEPICVPPQKRQISENKFNVLLEDCQWVLLKWDFDHSWYVY